jgi:trimeric autotransporter adhesin
VNHSSNIISNYAGIGPGSCYDGSARRKLHSGEALSFSLGYTTGLAFDSTGLLYIADNSHFVVFARDTFGNIYTVLGVDSSPGCVVDSGVYQAHFTSITSLAVDASDDLYISDNACKQIIKILFQEESVVIYAGGGSSGSSDYISATSATLKGPVSMIIDSDILCFSDYDKDAADIRCVNGTENPPIISTFAGRTTADYPSTLSNPKGLAGNLDTLYVIQGTSYIITEIFLLVPTSAPTAEPTEDPTVEPTVAPSHRPTEAPITQFSSTTVAGTGISQYTGDNGPAVEAGLINPEFINIDSSGNLFFTDDLSNGGVIRRIDDATGIITTYAGTNGTAGFGG